MRSRVTRWTGGMCAALLVAGALVWQASNAAFTATTNNPDNSYAAGTVALTDDDGSGTVVMNSTNLAPGASRTSCIRVDYTGSLHAAVSLFASGGGGALAPHVDLAIIEGTGGGYASCTGFVPESLAYSGTLSALTAKNSYGTGIGFFQPTGPGLSRTYQVVWTLNAATPNTVQGQTASLDLTWEARSTIAPAALVTGASGFTPLDTDVGAGGWVGLTSGWDHSCGVRGGGTLWCWGLNSEGQLGAGDTSNRANPTRVGVDSDWVSVSTSYHVSCALKTNGSLWCWGSNSDRQASDGAAIRVLIPVRRGNDSWRQVQTMPGAVCAVRIDDTLWCVGSGSNHRTGFGDTATRTALTKVGSSSWASLTTAGWGHICALDLQAQLWCWGQNNTAQLGVGDTAERQTPTLVSAGPWSFVSAGGVHTCGVRQNGSMWCWGSRNRDAVGSGSSHTVPQADPLQIGTVTTWSTVSSGDDTTCATRQDRSLWCWGWRENGQHGDGGGASPPTRTSPTLVPTSPVALLGRGGLRTQLHVVPWTG